MPNLEISGGVKIVIEQANHLSTRGHQVYILSPEGDKPRWLECGATSGTLNDWHDKIGAEDVILFTWDYDISYVMSTSAGRKIYLVQHFVHLIDGIFRIPDLEFISVSSYIREHTLANFDRDSLLCLNAIDHTVFYPRPVKKCPNQIATLGMGGWKGLDDVRQAVTLASADFADIELMELSGLTPDQMAQAYSSSAIYVSGSWYEGFCLPALEAMACGCAVITTDSKGINDFAVDGETCLKVRPRDPRALSEAIRTAANDAALRARLSSAGMDMAKRFTWSKSIDTLEAFLINE